MALFIVALILLPMGGVYAKNPANFNDWLQKFEIIAISKGIKKSVIKQAFDGIKYKSRIIELDRKQPEKTLSFQQYRKNILSKTRIKNGRKLLRQYNKTLTKISNEYGVPKHVIVALIGIETNYGRNTGGFNVIEALATLAYDGRRSEFFTNELISALKILQDGHISAKEMNGSWAGAMGQCQFMPSSFLRYAIDYNKDDKRDIWDTKLDVFASTANYLKQNGWKKGEKWGRKVKLTKHIDKKLFGLKIQKTLKEWHNLGIRKINGKALPNVANMKASLIEFTNGKDKDIYLVYNNYRVLMKWNYSTYFATAVGLLSDIINR